MKFYANRHYWTTKTTLNRKKIAKIGFFYGTGMSGVNCNSPICFSMRKR